MVNLTFFVSHIKIHIFTKFQVSWSNNAFTIAKTKFQKNFGQKSPDKHFCGKRPQLLADFKNSFWGRRYGKDEQHTKISAP